MESSTLVSPSKQIALEDECCICPAPAQEGQTFRNSKGKFCHTCFSLAQTSLSNKQLSNLKLKALRVKKRARGLCTRYRCTKMPVQGKTYCLSCSKYQNEAVNKYRVKKAFEGKFSLGVAAVDIAKKQSDASQVMQYRRITVASLLCD